LLWLFVARLCCCRCGYLCIGCCCFCCGYLWLGCAVVVVAICASAVPAKVSLTSLFGMHSATSSWPRVPHNDVRNATGLLYVYIERERCIHNMCTHTHIQRAPPLPPPPPVFLFEFWVEKHRTHKKCKTFGKNVENSFLGGLL